MSRVSHVGDYHRLPPEKILYKPKLLNTRVTPERAPYNPKRHAYAIIQLRVMPLEFLRRRLHLIGRFIIMRFSHEREYHRVPTDQVPYNPRLMNNRVTTEKTPCNSTFYLQALIPWRGMPIGLQWRRLCIIRSFTIMRYALITSRGMPVGFLQSGFRIIRSSC